MKRYIAICAVALLSLNSCTLDNFDAPDASIRGSFIDIDTGELIPQDIINGTKIRFEEQGWDNPQAQSLVVKCDGTYSNTKIFSGLYDFYFEESNFIPPIRLVNKEIKKGDNVLDFKVQPYIRIHGSSIERDGDRILARFLVAPTVNMDVEKVGFFVHRDYAVGEELSSVKVEQKIGYKITGKRVFTLEIPVSSLSSGKYWFRVGAKISAAGAKYNYADAVQLTI